MKQDLLQSIRKAWSTTDRYGFSVVEVVLASAVFVLLVTAFVGAYLYGQESTALAGNRARAVLLAEEGLEATRNIRDENFANLTPGSKGLAISNNQWVFSGAQDIIDIFTRNIIISPVGSDKNKKKVTVNITWQQNAQRMGTVFLVSYLTNWQAINMANLFSANTIDAAIDSNDNTKIVGITIQNIGNIPITVDAITTDWSGELKGTKIEAISIGGIIVWNGNDGSGKTQDITNVTLEVGANPIIIDFFDFSKNMTGATLTLTFTMSDGTTSVTLPINL